MSRIEVLIVEDECLVARDIQGVLEVLGYAVADVVSTGEEAIRAGVIHNPAGSRD
jgi:CheY-like chemotaxis protein